MRGALAAARGPVRFTGRRYDPAGTRRLSNRERDRSRMWRGGLVRARGHDRRGDRPRRDRTRLWAVALVALATTLALLAAGCGGSDETAEPATPSETPAPPSEETAPPSEEPAGGRGAVRRAEGRGRAAVRTKLRDARPQPDGQRGQRLDLRQGPDLQYARRGRSGYLARRRTGAGGELGAVRGRPHMDVPPSRSACSRTAIRSRRRT